MPGEIDGLVAQALHQAAVAGNDIGAVVDQLVAEAGREHALGQRHADRRGQSLAERAGGGLNPGAMAMFGVTGGDGAELAKLLQLGERDRFVTGQMQQRIEQHGAVPGRQHETVAVGPVRPGGVKFQEPGEQHGRHVGHAHRHAGMAGPGLFHGVHGQGPDSIGEQARVHRELGLMLHSAALFFRSTRRRMSGVRMSCMARSSLLPGMTMELARDMKLPPIIDTR